VVNAHNGPISILQFNGQGLFSAGFDGVITSWSEENLTRIWSKSAHTGSVTTLGYNRQMVITGGIDGEIKVLNFESGVSRDHAFKRVESIWKLAVSSDRVVIVGREQGISTLWTVPLANLE
jgi:F-box and WD-40 domain protein CDC4